jgi:hypothetical protein
MKMTPLTYIYTTLFIVFFVLKLTAFPAWSWWFVFSPLIVWLAGLIIIFSFLGVIYYLK